MHVGDPRNVHITASRQQRTVNRAAWELTRRRSPPARRRSPRWLAGRAASPPAVGAKPAFHNPDALSGIQSHGRRAVAELRRLLGLLRSEEPQPARTPRGRRPPSTTARAPRRPPPAGLATGRARGRGHRRDHSSQRVTPSMSMPSGGGSARTRCSTAPATRPVVELRKMPMFRPPAPADGGISTRTDVRVAAQLASVPPNTCQARADLATRLSATYTYSPKR